MKLLPPHRLNTPGDYYVQNACCTMCYVPFVVAPQLFGEVKDDEGYLHCFVKRQPETEDEHRQMLEVLVSAELQCMRFKGKGFRRQSILVRVVPELMDHINPMLLPVYLLKVIKTRWAVYKWRARNRKGKVHTG